MNTSLYANLVPHLQIYFVILPTHILSILTRWTVGDGEAAADEVILHVHHYEGCAGPGHLHHHLHHDHHAISHTCLLDPLIPAEDKLLLTEKSSSAHVEDTQQVLNLAALHPGEILLYSLNQNTLQKMWLLAIQLCNNGKLYQNK